MNAKEVERIKELIQKAELESAKSQGIIENIENQWQEDFGSKKLQDAKNQLEKLKQELEVSNNRIEKLYQDLLDSYDWDKLEEELN